MSYYLKKFWAINGLASLFLILSWGLEILLEFVSMDALQSVIDADMTRFLLGIGCLTVGFGIEILTEFLYEICKAHAIKKMNNQLRQDISTQWLTQTHQVFHNKENGAHLSQLTNDLHQIEQLAWNPIYDLIGATAKIIFSILALVTFHWSLLLVSFILSVLMLILPNIFQSKMENAGNYCSHQQALAVNRFKDALSGYDVLRFFGHDKKFVKEISNASQQIENAKYDLSFSQSTTGNLMQFISYSCKFLVLAMIGFLSIKGLVLPSVMMSGGNLTSRIYMGVSQVAKLRLSLAASKPYFDKITVHADNLRPASKYGFDHLQDAITVENLSFTYDKKPILKNASFRFEKGKKYAITGPSGCGKSTLLKLLLGWLPGYTGTIRFDDKNARDYTPEQIQRQMSYIEQNVFLFNTTIRENITLGDDFTDEQLQKALHDSALAGDLANMPDGLDTVVGEEGSSLSGGQKQRVAIARALIHNRSILLVDEGTSALDQKNADIVEKSLLANPSLTLILVSHHLTPERKQQFDQVYELSPVAAPAC